MLLKISSRLLLIPFVLLVIQLFLLLKPAPTPRREGRIAFVCPIQRSHIPHFLSSVPQSWFDSIEALGQLYFLVGNSKSIVSSSLPSGKYELLLLPNVDDDEYPPIHKEFGVFESLTRGKLINEFDFVFKFDSDTFVEPLRLERLIKELALSPLSHHYIGSPLHHCQCSPTVKYACKRPVDGVHYCSGAAVLYSRRTVIELAHRLAECLNPPRSLLLPCNSSDTWLGWCMNTQLDLRCQSARLPSVSIPHHGLSWAEPDEDGLKTMKEQHFCQELTSQGGVRHRHLLPRPFVFMRSDFDHCITFHPLKLIEDVRYVAFNVYGSNISTQYMHAPTSCSLAIGVFCTAANHEERMVIRNTWKSLSKLLNVVVFFVLADQKLAPHESMSLNTEREVFHDVLLLEHVQESYATLYEKTLVWFTWSAKHLPSCPWHMKLDLDSYPRLLPLLHQLHAINTSRTSLHYVGTQWGSFGERRNATVVRNVESPWFMFDQYPHAAYPPYMSGGAYVMSHGLAQLVALHARTALLYRLEDAGLGILLSQLQVRHNYEIQYHTNNAWDVEKECDVDAPYDNPAYSSNFNMYQRWRADMNGIFCKKLQRKTLPPIGVRPMDDAADMWKYLLDEEAVM